MTTVTRRPMLSANTLEAIAKSIGDTGNGLTGTEIGKILADSKIADTDPGLSKAKRLYNAFVNWQNANQCSNHILQFIQLALDPIRYVGQESVFQYRRNEINKRVAFIGVELSENGKYRNVEKATTISEAEQRASHFKYKLESRNIHATIMQYCTAELLVENYFHSVFEAIKSVAERIRQMTGVHAYGNALVETVFSTSAPLIRINVLVTYTDRSEHLGLANLIKGIFGLIRNPTAHEPKIKFPIGEEMALDIMTTISYIHKRLDKVL